MEKQLFIETFGVNTTHITISEQKCPKLFAPLLLCGQVVALCSKKITFQNSNKFMREAHTTRLNLSYGSLYNPQFYFGSIFTLQLLKLIKQP